jgi:hypothetical protein
MGGGSETTVVNKPDPPTAAETALTDQQVRLAETQNQLAAQQLAQNEAIFARQSEAFTQQQNTLEQVLATLNEEPTLTPEEQRFQEIQGRVAELTLEQLEAGTEATPEQVALIERLTEAGIEAGQTDIDRFRKQTGELITEQIASGRGLRPGDAPVLDLLDQTNAEALRQFGQLSASFRGAEAASKLNFPLLEGQFQNAQLSTAQGLSLAAQQFQADLRQNAIQNRLALAGSFGADPSGLGFNAGSNIAGTLGALASVRGGTTTQNVDKKLDFAALAGGLGQAAVGGAKLFALSDENLKEDIISVDDQEIYDSLVKLPLSTWKYAHDPEAIRHVGPMAQDVKRLFGIGDGRKINIIDAIGTLYTISRVLAKRVERLDSANDDVTVHEGPGLHLVEAA